MLYVYILCCSINLQPIDSPEAFQKDKSWCNHLWVLLSHRLVVQAGFQTSVVVLVTVALKVTLKRKKCINCFQQ